MQPFNILLVALFLATVCLGGEPDELHASPCTIMSILMGRREETEFCNLKMLLIRQLQTQSLNNPEMGTFIKEQHPKRNFLQLETCEGAGSICRTGGRRNCICPSSFVCDPVESGLHVCVKLRYFTQLEEMRR